MPACEPAFCPSQPPSSRPPRPSTAQDFDAHSCDERAGVGGPLQIDAGARERERTEPRDGGLVRDDVEDVLEDAPEAVDVVAWIARATGHALGREVAEASGRARLAGASGNAEVGEDRLTA